MKSHIERNTHIETINPKLDAENKNLAIFYLANVIEPRKFTQNFGGYPRSDIEELNSATSLAEQMVIAEKLIDYGNGQNENAGLTDAQIMLSHKSKYQQAPSEMVSWIEGQLHQAYLQREAVKLQKEQDGKINFDNTSNPDVNE